MKTDHKTRDKWYNIFEYHLLPARHWKSKRAAILSAIQKEKEAPPTDDLFDFSFIYPSNRQMQSAHEKWHKNGAFMSEIRADVGKKAAEGLAKLALYIRLEKNGAALDCLRDCFDQLWNNFSASYYSRGYETHQVRADILSPLIVTNTLDLVANKQWELVMKDYFSKGLSGWHRRPLIDKFPLINKALDTDFNAKRTDDLRGIGYVDFDLIDDREAFERYYFSAQEFDRIPYHKIGFHANDFAKLANGWSFAYGDGILKKHTLAHTTALCHRTRIIEQLDTQAAYTLPELAQLIAQPEEGTLLAIGQAIARGLMTFDKENGLDWNEPGQGYKLDNAGLSLKAQLPAAKEMAAQHQQKRKAQLKKERGDERKRKLTFWDYLRGRN